MNRAAFLLFFGASITASAFLAGCSSTSSTTGTGGGTTTTTHTSTGGSTTTTTSSTSSTSTTTTAAPKLDCASYCTEVMANCTGANAQYSGMDTCLGVCAGFTAPGTLADTSGDTLGCRLYHGGAAAGSASNATTHCPHAGPTGGDKDPKGTAGICGEPCTAFCAIATKVCGSVFATPAACTTACQGFKADTAAYSIADTATNDMGCRFYHLSAASASATAATTHCPHIAATSATCTM